MHKRIKNKISGIIPPLVTPINEQGDVCEKSVRNLINFVRPFSSALMPTLSSGEGWALSAEQFVDMIKYTVKYSHGLPVFAGIEYKTTKEVIKKALIAKKIGVDAVVITTPFRKKITQKAIFEHFRSIAKRVGLPIFIYNEKAISGNEISYATLKRVCTLGEIIGIKEASGSAQFTKKCLKLGVPIFQGWEHLCCAVKGVAGYVVPLSNLEPKVCRQAHKNPTQKNQKLINFYCKKYNILSDDWYLWLKKELNRRNIISTKKTI